MKSEANVPVQVRHAMLAEITLESVQSNTGGIIRDPKLPPPDMESEFSSPVPMPLVETSHEVEKTSVDYICLPCGVCCYAGQWWQQKWYATLLVPVMACVAFAVLIDTLGFIAYGGIALTILMSVQFVCAFHVVNNSRLYGMSLVAATYLRHVCPESGETLLETFGLLPLVWYMRRDECCCGGDHSMSSRFQEGKSWLLICGIQGKAERTQQGIETNLPSGNTWR